MNIIDRSAQEEILAIINSPGSNVTYTDVANYLGVTPQAFDYMMNHAKRLDVSDEKKIYKYFAKQGITKNQKGEYIVIAKQVIEHAALTNHQLSILTKSVQEMIQDEKITDSERAEALSKVRSFRFEVQDSLNNLEKLINGSLKG